MRELAHPAARAWEALRAAAPGSMLKWDQTGRALFVSDAPRRGLADAVRAVVTEMDLRAGEADGLMWIDLPVQAYQQMLVWDAPTVGPWSEEWFAEQSLLCGILGRCGAGAADAENRAAHEHLLRRALLATALGETAVRGFTARLHEAAAAALRKGDPDGFESAAAAAALVARWLWEYAHIGIPAAISVDAWRGENARM